MNPREPLPHPPTPPFQGLVIVKHPALDVALFAFPALSTGSTATPCGVFLPLILDTCRVLTNHAANCQGDFLASDREGRNRIPINDTYLDTDCYYFLGPSEEEANRNYPVVKTFSAFTFPSALPDRWARIADAWRRRPHPRVPAPSLSACERYDLVALGDSACAVTRVLDCLQCIYLVPKAEEAWFTVNDMTRYLRDRPDGWEWDIDHPANGVLLHADLQGCFDALGFVFYPGPSDKAAFVAYVVGRGWRDLPVPFHGHRVVISPGIPVQFVYAHFAYAVITLSVARTNALFDAIPEPPVVAVVRERIREKEERERQEARKRKAKGGGDEGEGDDEDADDGTL